MFKYVAILSIYRKRLLLFPLNFNVEVIDKSEKKTESITHTYLTDIKVTYIVASPLEI